MLKQLSFFSLLILVLFACKKDKQDPDQLALLSSYIVIVPECSGLCDYIGNSFLTVSDSLSKVYVIDRQGIVLDSLLYEGNNLEGVTFDPINRHIFVVEENTNEVVELDSLGNELNRFSVQVNNFIVKHGLEGITFDASSNHLFLVSEKSPGSLFEMTLDGQQLSRRELSFAEDYSSIYFDNNQNKLWILSDDSGTLTRCDLFGNSEKIWLTNIKKGEGLVVDSPNNKVYIISDKASQLFVFSF